MRKPKFEVVPGNEGYDTAKDILNLMPTAEWAKHFTFYSDTFAAMIIQKGSYCRSLSDSCHYAVSFGC